MKKQRQNKERIKNLPFNFAVKFTVKKQRQNKERKNLILNLLCILSVY